MTFWHDVLVYGGGGIAAVTGTWISAKFSGKASVRAAKVTAQAEDRATAVAEKSAQVEAFHQLVTDLQDGRRDDREQVERLWTRLSALEDDHEALKRDHERLRGQSVKDKTLIRHLITYVNVLRAYIRGLGQPIPEVPLGLETETDGRIR